MGAIFAPTRFSLVRISIRDVVADGKSLLRNSGVGVGVKIGSSLKKKRLLETAFEKVLRKVLRRCLAVGF